ncbi:MAG: hypothetical protein KME14_18605 [Tildeniella torsiva UHER 1998/13D]|jgi:hypothetical protein|nr:hypothetical protein [Tildeniella torsiva UHER 1998/13D]
MTATIALTKAVFTVQSGTHRDTTVDVHFNPVSLQYAVSNTLEEKGSGNSKKQYVSQSSGKLTMDLVFDTTHDGSDVRSVTDQIAQFMEPDAQKVPPVVLFEWGTYKFQGMVESYKETIDFFAPNGVPLRASVNLTLSRQDKVFEPSSYSKFDQQDGLTPDAVDVPAAPVPGASGGGQDATGLASQAGNPQAGRALAAANSLESMRFPSGPLTVDASITLGPPVAFASGGAGLSLGAGGGIGLGAGIGGGAGFSAGAGIGGSAGFSAGAGASAGARAGFSTGASISARAGFSAGASVAIGGRSSAGVSATGGAFAGLKSGRSRAAVSLDPSRLMPPPPAAGVTAGAGTSFQLGGQISGQGSSSLRADVGADVDLRSRIQFQER